MRQHGMLRTGGFTLLEAMVGLTILGVILGIGMPRMSEWIYTGKVAAAGQFYAEGFATARNQALTQNGASRLVLSKNSRNGQYDWQVDVCFPRSDAPCNEISANWSSVDSPAGGDPLGSAKGFKSLRRSAEALPAASELAQAVDPDGANAVYFTALGWVNPALGPRIERIDMTPSSAHARSAPVTAVVLTMAGNTIRCRPQAAAGDPQRCPP
jgi:type IV fimbrial biogenesis protein FimT